MRNNLYIPGSRSEVDERQIRDVRMLMHPIRFAILQHLRRTPTGDHSSSIGRAVGRQRTLVRYHLDLLERFGIVRFDYAVSRSGIIKGRSLKRYMLTEKFAQLTPSFEAILGEAHIKLKSPDSGHSTGRDGKRQ